MSLDLKRNIRVMVGVPSMDRIHARSALCLQALMNYSGMAKPENTGDWEVRLTSARGSILPNLRVEVVREAFEQHCTHVLWLDSDQTFPKQTLHRLLSHRKPVVGCNIATKMIPASPTARKRNPKADPKHDYGVPVFTDPDSSGLEKVWRLGCGIMLVHTSVYKKTGLNVFGMPWREEWQKYQGEDWTMCEAFEREGFEVWVDHDLSKIVGHLGEFEYTHDVVGELRKEIA